MEPARIYGQLELVELLDVQCVYLVIEAALDLVLLDLGRVLFIGHPLPHLIDQLVELLSSHLVHVYLLQSLGVFFLN